MSVLIPQTLFNQNQITTDLKLKEYFDKTGRVFLSPSVLDILDEDQTTELWNSFKDLQQAMSLETKLYPVPAETLFASWKSGHASIVYDPETNQIVSYSRIVPIGTSHLYSQIGLSDLTPNVYELGTVFTRPEFRGDEHKTARHCIANLYRIFADMHADNSIIIGTLTNEKVFSLFSEGLVYGINTRLVNHVSENAMYLGPTTCVCKIDEPLRGRGVAEGIHVCDVRTKRDFDIGVEEINIGENLGGIINVDEKGSLDGGACHMFISVQSNEALTRFMASVSNIFGRRDGEVLDYKQTMQNFIEALKRVDYFGNALTGVEG